MSIYQATPTSVMTTTNISRDAFLELEKLATWVYETAEMGEEKGEKNLSRCMDKEAREAKVRPLLEKLGYDKIQVKDQYVLDRLL
jgi:hypothetical protein